MSTSTQAKTTAASTAAAVKRKRVRPTPVPKAAAGELTGLPQVMPDGTLQETVLPDPYAVNKEMDQKRLQQVVARASMKPIALRRLKSESAARQAARMKEAEELSAADGTQVPEEETLVSEDEGDSLSTEDETAKESKRKKAKNEYPEGFPGLNGWKVVGDVQTMLELLAEGKIKDNAWVQYTRDRSTFIPNTLYKKLKEQAQHTGEEVSTLVEREKTKMLAMGRKKTLCTVAKGEQEGELKLTSIPPKGDRGSSFYPSQVRSWVLSTSTDGGILFYMKEFE